MVDKNTKPEHGRWIGYDRMAQHIAPAAAMLAKRVVTGGGPSLDIASGQGSGLRCAAARGAWAVGIDNSMDQLDAASTHGLPQVRGDAQRLPFRADSFSSATSNFGLIFARHPEGVFAEIQRCLRPRGHLAFSAWVPDGWPGAARSILGSHLGREPSPFPVSLGDASGVDEALRAAGLEVVNTEISILRWAFRDLDDAVETLTTSAGGLRALRTRLSEVGRWEAARAELRAEFATRCFSSPALCTLDDQWLLVEAIKPCRREAANP